MSQIQTPIRICPSTQGGGGGSLAVADAEGGGAADAAGDPVPSVCSVDDVEPAVDAAGAGAGEEEGGDVACGGVPPPHAATSEALAIDAPKRHTSVQAHDDQERIALSLVENGASATIRGSPDAVRGIYSASPSGLQGVPQSWLKHVETPDRALMQSPDTAPKQLVTHVPSLQPHLAMHST